MLLLLIVFLLVAAAQACYWGYYLRYAYYRPGFVLRPPDADRESPPLSVIVCFHNEEDHLGQCVERILAQDYAGDFELILVDDNSTDQSVSRVHPYLIADGRVRLLDPGPTRPGKKDALTYGISQARHNLLVLTDADCVPLTSQWLYCMAEPLRAGAELVLGVSPCAPEKEDSLLVRWQRFETLYTSIKYLGFAQRGYPYMGVGRNLAYRKSFFERAGGFAAHADLPGGDDDLLVANAADAATTVRMLHPAAYVYTHAQGSWRAYFRQRARHQSAGQRYPQVMQILLGGLALSHGLFYLLGFLLLFSPWWPLVLGLYALRLWLLVYAYHPGFYNINPRTYTPEGVSAAVAPGTLLGCVSRLVVAGNVAFFDAWVGPMYLYLALAGGRRPKGW
ncbi:glycosyltransferase [Neolewinella lacunae]|uniref:Glycosyltransferase n=1 Tax=Neolewinella lacunae TaxID=1517758 RepID=A0A923PPA8_9BACT|nr:glycosyltransferase [Neolewinella lacunae]MBC6994984.1 glycosyltransferase [Neolewinella lacunae]MDN3633245.1 glycosyltransferase [Neolewinella lacunae]